MRRTRSTGIGLALGLLMAVLPGCMGPYKLRGRVVEGPAPAMYFVPADSPELDGLGVTGVQFSVYRDPESLGRKLAGTGRSGAGGEALIEIRGFGTGWLQESWHFLAVRSGYQTAQMTAPLPSRMHKDDSVLLVVMTPGRSIVPLSPGEDIMRDYERFR